MTGRHARIVYDLDAPVPDTAPDTDTPTTDVCPIHGANCEAWA